MAHLSRRRVLSALLVTVLALPAYGLAPRPRVVDSIMPLQHEGRTFCTAFAINQQEHLWATAAHCVQAAAQRGYTMTIGRGWVVPIHVDYPHDLAVLRAEVAGKAIALGKDAPQVSDWVSIEGYPYGVLVRVKVEGKVAARNVPIGEDRPVSDILDITVAGGNSGSPVMDKDGRIVGLLWGAFVDSGHSLAVPYETIVRQIGNYWKR